MLILYLPFYTLSIFKLAKSLNYCIPGIVCDLTFGIMVITWVYARVYLYGRIIWSTLTEPELYVPQFALDPASGNWFPHFFKYIIAGLMMTLYSIILFWTALMFKMIYKISTNPELKDLRSDDEDEEDDETKDK